MGQKEERKMATSVFARGRGRGRGITPHQPLRRPGETFEQKSETTVATSSNGKAEEKSDLRVESLTKAIDELRFKSSDEAFAGVTRQAKEFATTDDKLKQIVDHLTQRCKADSEFAATAVAVGDRLCKLDEIGPKFRGYLLKAAQENYKNREVIKTKSVTEWLGVICFICEIFKVLRINEAPLKPLAGPLYVMLAELLKGENAEEIDCFNMQFRDIGKLLESVSEVCSTLSG